MGNPIHDESHHPGNGPEPDIRSSDGEDVSVALSDLPRYVQGDRISEAIMYLPKDQLQRHLGIGMVL